MILYDCLLDVTITKNETLKVKNYLITVTKNLLFIPASILIGKSQQIFGYLDERYRIYLVHCLIINNIGWYQKFSPSFSSSSVREMKSCVVAIQWKSTKNNWVTLSMRLQKQFKEKCHTPAAWHFCLNVGEIDP